jgi:hypothetical protein
MALFEDWAKAVQPATSTLDRWSSVFNTANTHFSDATRIDFADARAWMNGLINEDRSAHTVATVWRTALKTVFAWAVVEKLVENNPFRELRINVPRKCSATIWMEVRIASSVDVPRRGCHCLTRMFPVVSSECSQISSSSIHWERQSLR